MAKKSTKQGIGYINNQEEFGRLVVAVANIITQEFNRSSDNATAINNIKSRIDNFVGRSRQSFTKTDVYQVSYLMFYPIVKTIQEGAGKTFKDTQVNTLVAKLMTEGEYGNPSVVRRQTASAKLSELKRRLFPNRENLFQPTNEALTARLMLELPDVARRMLVRGTRSTTTTRVSNRTRRTTTPRSTTPRSTTPRSTTPRSTTPTAPAAAPAQRTTSSYPEQVNTENEFNQLVNYVNSIGEDSIELRKNKIFLCVPLFKYLLDKKFKEAPEPPSGIVSLTNADISSIFHKLNQEVSSLNLWISFGFLIYGFRTINTNRAVALVSYLPRNQRNRSGLNTISKKFGMEDRNFVKKILAHLEGKRILPSGPSAVVSYMVASSNALRAPFSNFIIGSYKKTEGKEKFQLNRPNFVFSYGEDSNRPSASASTPTATVTEINVPGYTSEATPPAPAPPPPVDNLIRNMKITDAFDFGVEWEHFGLGLPKIKRAMEKIGQPLYPEYVPYHDFDSYDRAIKPGMFPNGKVNKGWWVLQVDGSVRPDPREPASEFRKTKGEALINQRGRTFDTYQGEFVSPVLGGKRGLAIIKLVGNTLVNLGMRHNRTMGMHTHVTKKGFNRTNIKNLMYNYVAMEPLIESMMEPNRRSTAPGQYNRSHFKQLDLFLSSTENQVKQKLKQYILDKSDDDFYRMFGTSKQQAVNLKPFYGGNTIEFRQQGANFEADSVTMWIAFLFYLCEFSKKKRFQNFQWNNLISIMPVGLASFWYNRIQDLTGKSPYELSFQKS